jgi:abortive infection bacteriophage resistance protein
MPKIFLTLDEQIKLLRDTKGLIIEDVDHAREVLSDNNYYRLNAYFHQFLENDKFLKGTSLDSILKVYETDRCLRRLLLEFLEKIEIKARCGIGYELGREYGPEAFFDVANFKNAVEWENLQASFTKATNRYVNDPVADHYYNDLQGQFEIWVIVEYFSFGEISRLFGITDSRVQSIIAQRFNIHETLLKNWFEALAILRNVCAHYGYLRCRKFPTFAAIPKSQQSYIPKNRQLFSDVLAMSWLMNSSDRKIFIEQLNDIDADWPSYGFVINWKDLLFQ